MARRTQTPPPAEAYVHPDATRRNPPTEQTKYYMDDADMRAEPYRPPVRTRQGPVLAWDRAEALESVEALAGPLYIQEKISPGAFAESLRKSAPGGLFGPAEFNGLPENAAFEWYEHEGNWSNRLIRGPSLEAMASLIAKEGMAGKVQMVYFDPPYGIRFKATMQTLTSSRQVGETAKDIPPDPQTVTAFRDTYRNGIDSYLDLIWRTAAMARELLCESGSFFLQMGPDNVHRLALVLDEVFGAENRVETIPFRKSGGTSANTLANAVDYLLWYAKDRSQLKYRPLYEPLNRKETIAHMNWDVMVELDEGVCRALTPEEREHPDRHLPKGSRLFRRMPLTSPGVSETRSHHYKWNGIVFPCPPGSQWRVDRAGLDRLAESNRLIATGEGGLLGWKRYENEVPGRRITNLWSDTAPASDLHYIVETSETVVERCLLMATDPGDLVLDPTCGSGTTACVAEKWGRRWITTDTSAVAIALARQRLACAVFDYHLLKDSPEGAEAHRRLEKPAKPGAPRPQEPDGGYRNSPARGFVYERVPTVSAAILGKGLDVPPTMLVNRPLARKGVRRVSSAFTVESHSPFRVVAPEDALAPEAPHAGGAQTVAAALEKAGVETGNGARLRVEELTPWADDAGGWVTHTARSERGRVAVRIGRDDETVSGAVIDSVTAEAARIPGVSIALIVGFAFDADTRQERRGKLTVLKAQANQDLRIRDLGDGAEDNAFRLVGEPDIAVIESPAAPDEISVEVRGFDTYDPATAQLRGSAAARDIACWMIDTDHDLRAFYARRIHFPAAHNDRQIQRFRSLLGRRIDPALWSAMLTCRSAPFPKPTQGRIAVRIVTTTGLEMTKVIEVGR